MKPEFQIRNDGIIVRGSQMCVVATPELGSTRLADPNQNPGTLDLFLFIFRVIKFSFSKKKCRDSNPRPDPNGRFERSLVYFDVFIYLIKKFYYVISLRKRFQFWASP